jgi:hypothetical protein
VFGSGYLIHSFRLTFIQKIKFWKQPEHKKWGHGSIGKLVEGGVVNDRVLLATSSPNPFGWLGSYK